MASLMDDLLEVLEKENAEYEKLVALSMKKTPVIVSADLDELMRITDEEQVIVGKINHYDKIRNDCMKQIADVIHMDVSELTLSALVQIFEKRPAEHEKLASIYDRLKDTISQMTRVNNQNRELIQNSLELVQYDMNVLQSMKTAPETANYTKGAYNTGDIMGPGKGGFDAKQ